MKLLNNKLGLSIVAALMLSSAVQADTASDIAELKKEIAELKEKTQVLTDETSNLQTGFNYTTVDTTVSHSGLGSAASKVYYSKSPLSIGGYGEMYYAHTSNEGASNSSKVDVYRFVPYIGYKFSDNIILNAELEFEHGGVEAGSGGEVIVEFMYLDFLINPYANLRVGHMLVPMGLINEKHEPTLFNTVQRPNTSKNLIPSTWHESGVMAYGEIAEGLSYKVAGITGLDSSKTGDKWLRSGRGGSFENSNPKLGVVARVDYTGINGLLVGASTYADSDINIWDAHLDYNLEALRVYGVYTQSSRSNEAALLAGAAEATDAKGGFLNIGYDLLSFTSSKYKMPLFVQYESVAARDKLTNGSSIASIDTTTVGINYFPHEQVVLKADYAMQKQDGIADKNIASLSVGFIF
ncbi:MAG: porin [Sulfurimonas sp. RIFOXYD12_FULL_33_39]|uniref:porin n=1 Tax=unclassified Sulfurimonas TaxID=2623549 RepID=UPI0008B33662|nr:MULTISPECIES: porin [unclassified Sulfurimonas]OHE09472.1 MAG: porin [Sulfurimonas sp. RIFOXYD12_FULL_33_39]OHE12747.1 MAG: porin [Sulfurimonas sp. RIFOXYD2_FULL_34_21]